MNHHLNGVGFHLAVTGNRINRCRITINKSWRWTATDHYFDVTSRIIKISDITGLRVITDRVVISKALVLDIVGVILVQPRSPWVNG